MQKYVLGFAFCNDYVALIEKKRGPRGLIGYMNGIGGKIEMTDDTVKDAMVREFREETGYQHSIDWRHYGRYGDGVNWSIELFTAWLAHDHLPAIKCTEEGGEQVKWCRIDLKDTEHPMANLRWLIPMAINSFGSKDFLDITEKVV